jgi:hypothetical protein
MRTSRILLWWIPPILLGSAAGIINPINDGDPSNAVRGMWAGRLMELAILYIPAVLTLRLFLAGIRLLIRDRNSGVGPPGISK